jgi:hypothetical protein
VAKGNPRRPRGVAASDSLPLFPPDVSDRPVSGRKERVANVVPIPRKAGPNPEELARKAMARQPTGASGKKVKLSLTVFLSREQVERLTARAIRARKNLAALVTEILESSRPNARRRASPAPTPTPRSTGRECRTCLFREEGRRM